MIRGIRCSATLLEANLSAENRAGHRITFARSTHYASLKSPLPQPLSHHKALNCDDAKVNGIGHRPWSDQHFSERLQSHSALAEYGLERTRVRKNTSNQQTLSRRRFASAYDLVPGRYQAWLGVRFLTNAENTGNDDDSA